MKTKLQYCATDNEIYEVLMSSRQKFTEAVVLELAKDRGIIYSSNDSREAVIEKLALLPHDFNDLAIVLSHREHAGRAEKITSVTLHGELTIEDIKEVSKEYKEQAPADEKVITQPDGADRYVVKVHYSEVDYSKTRLIQRKPKEADVEFVIEEGKTTVRMPANAKAKEIFKGLKARLDSKKKTELPEVLIELSDFNLAAQRTKYFTSLIGTLPEFKLDNVTSVKVEPIDVNESADSLGLEDDQEQETAAQEALAMVKKVAISGESLLVSDEYQALQKKGFFITSIIWRSKQTVAPYSIVEFEAAFEEPHSGRGFKYSVRGSLNFIEGEYTKTLRPIAGEDKQKFLGLIEQTAFKVIAELRKDLQGDEESGLEEKSA